ncbi:3-dehydroquinate synthase [Stratiformator vulcanicus]|uniref:3-dehydroquinate synthase n=1 Tax=Stratiformator vulcanicus TaxID=2527980 RepID=A0A517QXK3_9PLAN|nr:3-dehydroquinate synthase [Stratiformator vulcanicus]QDT36344.1 3-dehydroquinate synthase [Stratiformator vulcanicus]
MIVSVSLAERSYGIAIGPGLLSQFEDAAERLEFDVPRTVIVVTDENLRDSHAESVAQALAKERRNVAVHAVPAGERSKSMEQLSAIYDALVDLKADRKSLVIAVGGGVVGDLSGFAAASYNRGMPFVQVPTSLLAMVDSSVGGKTGINHPKGKNLIGAFHQPVGVIVDTDVLSTLPDRDYRGGLAEVVKYGVILDAEFFDWLEQNVAPINARDPAALEHVVARSCELKAYVVKEDERETTGLRAILNYGHTFAHAFEALAGYGELSHGEAVAIGMICASRLAELRGLIDAQTTTRQIELLCAFGLPASLGDEEVSSGRLRSRLAFDSDEVIERMKLDKKNSGGKIRFILPKKMGEVGLFDDCEEEDVRGILAEIA